jgi:hypothetical protein
LPTIKTALADLQAGEQADLSVEERFVTEVQFNQSAQVRHAVEVNFVTGQAVGTALFVMGYGNLHLNQGFAIIELYMQDGTTADLHEHRLTRSHQRPLQREVEYIDQILANCQAQAGWSLKTDTGKLPAILGHVLLLGLFALHVTPKQLV